MRIIHTDQIIETIRQMCIDANLHLSDDVKDAICGAIQTEKSPLGRQVLEQLEQNMDIADAESIPICQDTGMAVVFLKIGQDLHIEGMNLTDGDEIVGMQLDTQGESLMIVSEKGLGKCTLMDEFTSQNRGGKGIKCYKITEKTGNIVGVKAVNKDDEMMLITTEGIIIRIRVSDTALLGRLTAGVKLMNLKNDVVIASIAKVREDKSLIQNEEEAEVSEESEIEEISEPEFE